MKRYSFGKPLSLRVLLGVLALLVYVAPSFGVLGVRRRTAVVAYSAGAATSAAAASSAAASQQQAAAAQQTAAAQQESAAAQTAAAESAAAASQASAAAAESAAAASKAASEKSAAPAQKTTQQRLEELQSLYKQGLISESEYNEAKAKILGEISP